MKKYIINIAIAILGLTGLTSCFNLDEVVFDKVTSDVFYEDESSVAGAVASVFNEASKAYVEYFYYLQEFSADQVSWRVWNGGTWGYDEGEKLNLGVHNWNAESKIIKSAWESAWTTVGLCNNIENDLKNLSAETLKISPEKLASYIAEVRTLRAWAYYNLFEIWGGALPIFAEVSATVPPSASKEAGSFEGGCKKVYDFIATELDQSWEALAQNTPNRPSQAMNRLLKARLLLNAELFIGEDHYQDCADECEKIIRGDYGSYELASDFRQIFGKDNDSCKEIIMAFATEVGQSDGAVTNMRVGPFLAYDFSAFGLTTDAKGWNCLIVAPSKDNTGNILITGGTDNPKSFILDYGDKLGGVFDRFADGDIRKQPYYCDTQGNWNGGIFLMGRQTYYRDTDVDGVIKKAGVDAIPADADRTGQDLVYVDQVGTFINYNNCHELEPVMSPQWGETNSGYRLIKYAVYPDEIGWDYRNTDEVQFRLAEAYYMLAECNLRGATTSRDAKSLVNDVRKRYFSNSAWATQQNVPGPGFDKFDLDWMLSEWGKEFIGEGNRRRTDLRRYDKFTQGQWWFFGRAENYPAKRSRKFEWFPLPSTALNVNPGLQQHPDWQ